MLKSGLLINGNVVEAENGQTFDRRNPLSDQVATQAAAATKIDADKAVDAASAAFPEWSATSPSHRREILNKAAEILLARTEDFVEAMMSETGATQGWSRFNCKLGAEMLVESGAMTTRILGETMPANRPGTFSTSIRQAAGISLGIAPWNAPIVLGVRSVAMPLACGNTAILKSSGSSPRVHSLIGEVLSEAGIPAGGINVISNAPGSAGSIIETMIARPEVRRVNFTGSTYVGRIIGRLCGEHLKPCLLELGGKAPLIVLADANIDEAVNATAFGAYFHQGQICMGTEKLIVMDSVADEFVDKMAAKAKSLPAGDPTSGTMPLGTMIRVSATNKVKDLIDDAIAKGAKLVVGGEVEGPIMQPAVVDHVTRDMELYHKESFGPVICIIRTNDVDEAVQCANDTEYGLAASIFGESISAVMPIAMRIRSGSCHINGPTIYDEPQMPFGGLKNSGVGRFGGQSGVEAFTDLRWITIQTGKLQYPI